ncbi:hypothetical protein ACFL0A_01545 [Patescibacteria group bacterium]
MKIPKLKTKNIFSPGQYIKVIATKDFLKKLPKILGTYAFSTFLGFFIFSSILGLIIFYKYGVLAERAEPEVSEEPLQFKEKTYQEVLKIWEDCQKKFEQTESKIYPDPFREIKERFQGSVSILSEEQPEETVPELPSQETKKFQEITNLFEFYLVRGEILPSISERAEIWENKNLGLAEEYQGFSYQNPILLEELKKELTE